MNKVPVASSVAGLIRTLVPSRGTGAHAARVGGIALRDAVRGVSSVSAGGGAVAALAASASLPGVGRHGGAAREGARGVSSVSVSASSPAERRAEVLELVRAQVASHLDAFYVVDLGEVARKHAQWRAHLPRVRPFYAVKCNDDPRIVETLAGLGAGFDCASKGEMSMALAAGVPASDIIFAHPAKQVSHLHYAAAKGVVRMTFDNEEELRKVAREHPGAELVLRILTDDSASVCRLGLKFGAPLASVGHLLGVARDLGVRVVGISYHVGSGNGEPAAFAGAVRDARTAFDVAARMGMPLSLLDIGGGFPGSELGAEGSEDRLGGSGGEAGAAGNPYAKHPSFATIAGAVRGALDTYFPEGCGVTLMAEPGRFFVKSSHVLAVNVVGKRPTTDEATGGTRYNYYVNDGLYGSFNCVMYDHVTCAPSLHLAAAAAATRATPLLGAAADALEDTIVRVAADGTPLAADAVGLALADELHTALAPAADADAEVAVAAAARRMTANGMEDVEEVATHLTAGAALSAAAATVFASTAPAGCEGVGAAAAGAATAAARRAFSYSTLGAPAPAAAAAAAAGRALHPTTLWGPTCDSIDKITDAITLPELAVGDWLVFENMGAYTIAGSCKFNGFPLATKVYMNLDGSLTVQKEEKHD